MSFENYEGTAIDTSVFTEEVQPIEDAAKTDVDETVDTGSDIPPVDTTPENIEENTPPSEVEIPGLGKVNVKEVIDWKNGSLRQSDYTRKTQELAKQREEVAQAVELYNYLSQNPHIIEAMQKAEINPTSVVRTASPTIENQMLRDVAYKQREIETNMKLAQLHEKYGDIDEIALFNKATELRTDDLEFVYKALSYDKSSVDQQSLIDAAKEQLKAELLANKGAVSTTVSTSQSTQSLKKESLTEEESKIARGMGLSDAEYLKWR